MSDLPACYNGRTCPGWNGHHAEPTDQPFCHPCLDRATRDIRGLVYDYVDLAQLHETSMSQAASEHTTGGGHESPTLLADHVEALQAEIVHALSVWEYELRVAHRLSDPRTFAPMWRRTVYDQIELTHGARQVRPARPGHIVQRAVTIITSRLDRLAALPAARVCPSGVEDDPVDMHGWEAIHHLQDLHGQARAALGRTTRRFWIPGECWTCGARPTPGQDGPLWRSEPKRFKDPMTVNCQHCDATRSYADYETYQQQLLWPNQDTDTNVRIAA